MAAPPMDHKRHIEWIVAAQERLARSRARLEQAHRSLDVSHALLMETAVQIRHSRRQVEESRGTRQTNERPQHKD